jgi:hypothetical protein
MELIREQETGWACVNMQVQPVFNLCASRDGLKSIFETGFKRHSEPRLPSTAQINH